MLGMGKGKSKDGKKPKITVGGEKAPAAPRPEPAAPEEKVESAQRAKPPICATHGHRSHEIDDNGRTGQIFWCENCNRVVAVRLNGDNVVVVAQKPATVLP